MKCTIDIAPNGHFALDIPSAIAERSHTITVPASSAGITILKKILLERQREGRREIGHNSSPIQAQVEAWLNAEKRAAMPTKAVEKNLDISVLNLDELDL